MILYFSATGNCKYVAERIAAAFDDTAVSIEKAETHISLSVNEMLGFVTPVNWWELPVLTREFMQNITIDDANVPYSYIVTTYGTTPGCTFTDAKKILKGKGIELAAGFSIKMPDNWTPIFNLSDTEEVRQQNEEAEHYIDEVLKHIRKRSKGNINTNPVIIRKILSQLSKADLITVARGTGGITINRPLSEISFYDVYQAIEPVENGDLFHFHEAPNPECPVGRNIHKLLDGKLKSIQDAMENEMKKYTLSDLHSGMEELLGQEE